MSSMPIKLVCTCTCNCTLNCLGVSRCGPGSVCVCVWGGGGGGVRAYGWVFAGGIYVVYPGYVSLCLVVLVHLLVRL